MKLTKTDRNFPVIEHDQYPDGGATRLAQCSSIIYDYPDAMDRPGTSALWIGENHHLNREEVEEFVGYLTSWLETGSFR